MNMNLTAIAVVIDRSGSMNATRSATLEGFNAFLTEQKALPGDALLTLALFNGAYELVYDGIPLKDVPDLTEKVYVPDGYTALYDAIGKTINALGAKLAAMAEADRPGKVLLAILTDGEENFSKEFSQKQVQAMIKHQQEVYSWDVLFMGGNQDAVLTGGSLGISAMNSVTYDTSMVGTRAAYSVISQRASMSRGGISASDIQKALEAAKVP